MKRCPYAAELVAIDGPLERRWLVYCRRRAILSAWHLHDAPVPLVLRAARGVRVRWRSSSAPDFHEDDPRGPARHLDDREVNR